MRSAKAWGVAAVEDGHVGRISAAVDAGRALVEGRVGLRAGGPESDWLLVQSSSPNTNAAKSTSRVSSTSRSSVDTPGLNTVVHGSTSATSSSPRVSACTSFACLPDEPRKMRGFMSQSQSRASSSAFFDSNSAAVRIPVSRSSPSRLI